MIKIALVVPYKNFVENAAETFAEHNAVDTLYDNEEYVLEEVIVSNDTVEKTMISADVIIIRGLFAKLLNRTVRKDVPVVEIPIPATDLLRAILYCRREFDARQIGVIGIHNLVLSVDDIVELVDARIKGYVMHQGSNAGEFVDQAMLDGCDAVVGGLDVCSYAETIPIASAMVKTGRETFWQSISSAKRAARISRNEQEKTGRLQAMLDSSHDVVFSFDVNTRQIEMANHSAEVFFGLKTPLLGLNLQDAPFPANFTELLLSGNECRNEVVPYNDALLNVNKFFIKAKNRVVGTMVNIQEVQGIQMLERSIRRKIYNRGHVAKATFENVQAHSPGMRRVVSAARKYAVTDSNILLLGESGTGKEIFAQSIHNHSVRRDAPFVAVNCAAIPESLLESELFGYVQGAFTGAHKSGKPGYFELAHGGTIFLDEIGELPLPFQSKLLRAIQEREIMRLGGDSVVPVDVRIVAATNQNLEELAARKLFRADLLFRLDVLRIEIPELRERREDIPLLAGDFLQRNFPDATVDDGALEELAAMDWPGNVRQLQNFCERLVVLNRGRAVTRADVLDLRAPSSTPVPRFDADVPRDDGERETFRAVLEQCRYNRSLAAKQLGIARSTLWRKMRHHGL